MPTPPMLPEETLPAEDTPAALVKPRRKPEPAWKRYDHLIHDGPAYFEALRKDRLAQARAERQEKVRRAALSLFAARSVAATSLARLAWHMEISPASLRRAYPDKPALLAGILEAHVNALLEAVGTAQEEADAASFAPRAKLCTMATAALRYLAGEGVLTVRIAPQAEALLEPLSRAALAGKRRWLVALFASAIEESLPGLGARGGEPPARALLALLETAASWSDADRGSEDLAAYAARAVAGVLAMANPPPEDGNGKPRDQDPESSSESPPGPETAVTPPAETPPSVPHASALSDPDAPQLCCAWRRRGALPAPRAPCYGTQRRRLQRNQMQIRAWASCG
ncbi:MAG: TetR/AcrR family transcriptional regulator, partial [Acetobacteraceae bacterium]|nr:TetR/AcrR family transcriptional regulator [Acetobacteraceae bacterium]